MLLAFIAAARFGLLIFHHATFSCIHFYGQTGRFRKRGRQYHDDQKQ